MMQQITEFLVGIVHQLGYVGLFLATLIESTFVPIPAEVTMLPAGILVGQGKMNYALALLSSTSGVVLGSTINYWVGYRFGRGFIVRYGKYFLLKAAFLDKVELFFQKHGSFATFAGRLIPGVRHYIAFPAGMARMEMKKFLLYTTTGGGLWMLILLQLGYMAGKDSVNGEVKIQNLEHIVIILAAILAVIYLIRTYALKR